MAAEQRRACGFRKHGGLYLCSDNSGAPCCKMPILLEICPTCNGGIKQSRQWQWIDPVPWTAGTCTEPHRLCPLADGQTLAERVGLIWIGEQFYPTPETFQEEAARMGVSRRIKAVPHGFVLGETWVWFAHSKVRRRIDAATGEATWIAGVFRIFKPDRIEKIVWQSEYDDDDEMERLRERGITPVPVPDEDKDHAGKEEEPMLEGV